MPEARFRFDVRLARLASRSPATSFAFAPAAASPLVPFVPWPPALPCGCSMSPKKEAPTAFAFAVSGKPALKLKPPPPPPPPELALFMEAAGAADAAGAEFSTEAKGLPDSWRRSSDVFEAPYDNGQSYVAVRSHD